MRAADGGKDRRIFLRADRAVPYGELMDVLELLRIGGYLKVALVALEGVPGDAAQGDAAGHHRDDQGNGHRLYMMDQDVPPQLTRKVWIAATSVRSPSTPVAPRWR